MKEREIEEEGEVCDDGKMARSDENRERSEETELREGKRKEGRMKSYVRKGR